MSLSATDPALMPATRATHAAVSRAQEARTAAMEQFLQSNRVQLLWRALTNATDQLLADVAEGDPITIFAVGGYGRRELFPYSDVDVLILVHADAPAGSDQNIIRLLQQLWDMHIPVSHATRTMNETIHAARHDATIAAALMDLRLVHGDRKLYLTLKKRLREEVYGQQSRDFVTAKLNDRDQRHEKCGDSRFMLEPNIKEGKGGLRDLHTLNWLARHCYGVAKASELVRDELLTRAEWLHYRHAYVFFSTVRAHMHILRGRADERLTFDLQTRIAAQLKFRGRTAQQKAERFMLRYFQFTRQVGALTRNFCALLEEENLRNPTAPFTNDAAALPAAFIRDGGRLNFAPSVDISADPSLAVELFYVAQHSGLDIHPRAHISITRALPAMGRKLPFEGAANKIFLDLLLGQKSPDTALRRMNETGLLGALIPEFGRITGMMQYDGYHTYTVDEHTIVAVGNLAMIESGLWSADFPLASIVAKEIGDRAPLYLAMLCHDIAKGMGGAHAEKGEALVERIAIRLGLKKSQGELAAWLVKHHLLLSETATKRDLDDPKTIEDMVAKVQSPERLRLLLLVTVADIKAVGPAIWNGWKGALLRDLYHRSMLQMGVGSNDTQPQTTIREEILADAPRKLQSVALDFFEQRLPSSWWYRPRAEQIAGIKAYGAWQQKPNSPALVIAHDNFRAITEITCCITHHPALFHTLAGVMAWIGASIVSARIMVLGGGGALATIGIQDMQGQSFAAEQERLASLPELITKGLAGTLDFEAELPRRRMLSLGREVVIAPSVFIDNQVSANATVIEVNARDRLGLLYDILVALDECHLQVMTAHIATYGKKAVDVFYVKDAYGIKIIHPAKLASVQLALLLASGAHLEAA